MKKAYINFNNKNIFNQNNVASYAIAYKAINEQSEQINEEPSWVKKDN